MNLQTFEPQDLIDLKQRVIDAESHQLQLEEASNDIEVCDDNNNKQRKRRRSTASIDFMNIYYYKSNKDDQVEGRNQVDSKECGRCLIS